MLGDFNNSRRVRGTLAESRLARHERKVPYEEGNNIDFMLSSS